MRESCATIKMLGNRTMDWCEVVDEKECAHAKPTTISGEAKVGRSCTLAENEGKSYLDRILAMTGTTRTDGACACMGDYKYHGKSYSGCIETPDLPGKIWCFVVGGKDCPDATDAKDLNENRKMR